MVEEQSSPLISLERKFNFVEVTATKKIFDLRKRIRAVAGGTSASKTISILVWLIDYCTTKQERDKLVSVVSESFPHLSAGVILDFKNLMKDRDQWEDSRWNETRHFYTFETGNKLEFLSVDTHGKAHGPRRDVLFLNECNHLDFNIVDQLIVRTREVVWMDWNPTVEFWFYTEMLPKRDDIDFITLTYLDNEALDPITIKEIESHKNNPHWWACYGEGRLGTLVQRIYKDWLFIDDIPHEAKLERYGLDFGYSCFIGDTLVECPNGNKKISELHEGDWVLTRLGYRRVKNVFDNGKKAIIKRRFLFEDGSVREIEGTPDHNFNVNNLWKPLAEIQKGDRLYVSMEKSTTDTKMENIQIISIGGHEKEALSFIEKSIKNIMETSRRILSFIILMVIHLTTILEIWLLLLLQNMLKFIRNLSCGMLQLLVKNITKELDTQSLIGYRDVLKSMSFCKTIDDHVEDVKKNLSLQIRISGFVLNLAIIVGNIQQKKTKQLSYAKTALKGLWGTNILNLSHAHSCVRLRSLLVEDVETIGSGNQSVFNIEVEGIHEYFANGMLVYNCDPTAILAVYKYNGGFILDEITYQKGLSNKQIADILLNVDRALVVGDSSEPKSIDEIKMYGVNIIGANKGSGSVNQGIQFVQDQRISVTKRSLNLIKEYRNYIWITDKRGDVINTPEGGNDHLLDALRYALESYRPAMRRDARPIILRGNLLNKNYV